MFYVLNDNILYSVSIMIFNNRIYDTITNIDLKDNSNELFSNKMKGKTLMKSI